MQSYAMLLIAINVLVLVVQMIFLRNRADRIEVEVARLRHQVEHIERRSGSLR